MQEIISPDLTALRERVKINTINISRLEGVVSQLEKRIDNLEKGMRALRVELAGRIDNMHAELGGRIGPLEERIDNLNTELNGRIDQVLYGTEQAHQLIRD